MIAPIVSLILVAVLLWAVESLISIDPFIKRLIQVLIVVAVVIYLIRAFGIA